jgi:hypothetical protein
MPPRLIPRHENDGGDASMRLSLCSFLQEAQIPSPVFDPARGRNRRDRSQTRAKVLHSDFASCSNLASRGRF